MKKMIISVLLLAFIIGMLISLLLRIKQNEKILINHIIADSILMNKLIKEES